MPKQLIMLQMPQVIFKPIYFGLERLQLVHDTTGSRRSSPNISQNLHVNIIWPLLGNAKFVGEANSYLQHDKKSF